MDPKKISNIFIFRASAAETWTTVAEPNKKSNIFRLRVCAFFVAPQKGFNAVSKLDRKIVLDAARKNVAKRTALAGSASG